MSGFDVQALLSGLSDGMLQALVDDPPSEFPEGASEAGRRLMREVEDEMRSIASALLAARHDLTYPSDPQESTR